MKFSSKTKNIFFFIFNTSSVLLLLLLWPNINTKHQSKMIKQNNTNIFVSFIRSFCFISSHSNKDRSLAIILQKFSIDIYIHVYWFRVYYICSYSRRSPIESFSLSLLSITQILFEFYFMRNICCCLYKICTALCVVSE